MTPSAKSTTVHIIPNRDDDVLEYDNCYRSDECLVAYERDLQKNEILSVPVAFMSSKNNPN